MSLSITIVLAALPWVIVPALVLWRLRDSASLDAYAAQMPADAPPVSVAPPARDGAHTIQGVLSSTPATRSPHDAGV